MTDYSELTVGQKLAKARLMFLKAGASKSGKNMKMEFKYFELEDIQKFAIPIFDRLGLINDMKISRDCACANVYNAHNMTAEPITFSIPYAQMDQIVSRAGNTVTNEIQALGGSVTYLRRYLWMLILEVIEPDEVDANIGLEEQEEEPIPAPKKKKSKAPATVEERAEAKKELTSSDGNATEDQISELKSLCKKLIGLDEKQEDFVNKIAVKTDSFTKITETACTSLCVNLKEMIEAYGTANENAA